MLRRTTEVLDERPDELGVDQVGELEHAIKGIFEVDGVCFSEENFEVDVEQLLENLTIQTSDPLMVDVQFAFCKLFVNILSDLLLLRLPQRLLLSVKFKRVFLLVFLLLLLLLLVHLLLLLLILVFLAFLVFVQMARVNMDAIDYG